MGTAPAMPGLVRLSRPLVMFGVCLSVLMVVLLATPGSGAYTKKELSCGTCRLVLADLLTGIESTNETYSIQTRFRIDEKKRVPYSRSEYNINEILESLCKKIGSVGVQHFGGQVPHVIKAGALKGTLKNLEMSGDANKVVRRVCDDMLEDFIDEITLTYHRSEKQAERKVCVDITRSCSDSQFEELEQHAKVYLDEVVTPEDAEAEAKKAEAIAAATANLEQSAETSKPKSKKKSKKKKKNKKKKKKGKRKKTSKKTSGGSDGPSTSEEEQADAGPTAGGSSSTSASSSSTTTPQEPASGGSSAPSHSDL